MIFPTAVTKTAVLLLALLGAPALAQAEAEAAYSISADQKRTENGVTTYRGNAKVVVSNVVIEADTISIFQQGGVPLRIEAAGNPIRFYETVPDKHFNGIARTAEFLVPELKLTLTEYLIKDPSGNEMKGKKASFVLAP